MLTTQGDKAVLKATQSFFKEKTNKVIFQPHLYSRTRDFMEEFAKILSQFDQIALMDIYPAARITNKWSNISCIIGFN